MTEALLSYLACCPVTAAVAVDTLGPGPGTGLFYKGVSHIREDIMGNKKPRCTFILRHRGPTDEHWAETFGLWILNNPPVGLTVIPKKGGQVSPTKDGFSTWEVELEVTQQS